MPDAIQQLRRSWSLKPASLLDWWTIAVFSTAIFGLLLLRGLNGFVLVLFMVPPLLAFFLKHVSERHSSRSAAALFLTLVSFGEILSHLPRLFPKLGGIDARLSPEHDRILAWYLIVYLLYLFAALPFFLFVRALSDHAHKRAGQFSRFTSVLGIFACSIAAPCMISICSKFLHLLPVT